MVMAIRRSSPLLGVITIGVATGAIWWFGARLLGSARLPGPGATLRLLFSSMVQDPVIEYQGGGSHGFLPHVWITLRHTLAGVTLGSVAGFVIALCCFQSRLILEGADTVIEIVRVVPPLILIPLLTVVESGSYFAQDVSVELYSGLLLFIYTVNALRRVPLNYIELSTLLGAGKWRSMACVQIPSILPHLLGPLRLAFALGFGISIVAEYLVSPNGIGRVMLHSKAFSAVNLVLVGVCWTIVLALLTDGLLLLIFARLIRWTERRQLVEWLAR